jgi:hypothetical protein
VKLLKARKRRKRGRRGYNVLMLLKVQGGCEGAQGGAWGC